MSLRFGKPLIFSRSSCDAEAMEEPPSVSERMRKDWNERARVDAHFYVAFGGRDQTEEEFLATAADVLRSIEGQLKRLPAKANRRAWRALEIGCGPGRLMRPLSRHFGEIHGVDVSDEMIRLGRERLRDIPHAHFHTTDGATLPQFADESFEFIYSYAVFQHIPSREVVLEYMREIRRLLKPGGVFHGQFNGLAPSGEADTWGGVAFSAERHPPFTRENGLRLLESGRRTHAVHVDHLGGANRAGHSIPQPPESASDHPPHHERLHRRLTDPAARSPSRAIDLDHRSSRRLRSQQCGDSGRGRAGRPDLHRARRTTRACSK